jgi:hypothetical protein
MAMSLEYSEPLTGFCGLYAGLTALDAIAERRIREAQARGDFDDLPGTGAPLQLDDAPLVAEDLRAAYRVLKNAGYLPPELEIHREIRDVEQLMAAARNETERDRLLARIRFLLARAASCRRGDLRVQDICLEKIAGRSEACREK